MYTQYVWIVMMTFTGILLTDISTSGFNHVQSKLRNTVGDEDFWKKLCDKAER